MTPFQVRQQKQFNHIVEFIDKCQTNFKQLKRSNSYAEWSDTVTIKLDASNQPGAAYTCKFGSRFMDEETLIISDEDNNIHLVYCDKNKVVAESLTPLIRVLNNLRITPKYILHKERQPANVPPHIRINLNFIETQNNIQNANTIHNVDIHNGDIIHKNGRICSKFAGLSIPSLDINTLDKYLNTYFIPGDFIPLKQLSRHFEWKKTYRSEVTTRSMDICKSCRKRFRVGCNSVR